MQFYKYEGRIIQGAVIEERDYDARRDLAGKIYLSLKCFNQRYNGKTYFFVSQLNDAKVIIGIITKEQINLRKELNDFCKELELRTEEESLSEVTFDFIHSLLLMSNRHNYIENMEEVLEEFELDGFFRFGRRMAFSERLIEDTPKHEIYMRADSFLIGDVFTQELDRIYQGGKKTCVYGHPVHYMIQTDDKETRDTMCDLLLKALYMNKRISNRRCIKLDVRANNELMYLYYECIYKSSIGGTVIVEFLSTDEVEDDYASTTREIVELLSSVMRKYRNQVLTVLRLPRECNIFKEALYEALGTSSFVEFKEEFADRDKSIEFLKKLASELKVRTDKNLFDKVEVDKGYLATDLHAIFDEWYDLKLRTSIFPQYKDAVCAKTEAIKSKPKGTAYEELMEMVGITEAKEVINQALNYYKAQKIFVDKGMTVDYPAMHMIFTGKPGTAKTSVARLFAKIMKENDLVSKGTFVEVGRSDLVGKFVGWTAPTIKKKFMMAKGGVLFIDEAYSLVDDRSGSFGDEAINTIVQEMENHREDVVVIFAGYPDEMEKFMQKNPGLRSRIAFHIPFPDYSTEELCGIAKIIAKNKGLSLTDEACRRLAVVFDIAKAENDFGNGRYVRNVIEKAKMAMATRLLTMDYDAISSSDITTILPEDIAIPDTPKHGKKPFGFAI